MDYQKWSEEYRQEADKLRERIRQLREESKHQLRGGAAYRALSGRIYTLYSMYLECKHTADYLADYAKQQAHQSRSVPERKCVNAQQ